MKLAGLYAEKLNNPAKALESAKRARTLAPNDLEVGRAVGRLGFQSGDHQWAVGVLQEVVQKSPPQADLSVDFAWSLYSVGRVEEARERMRQMLKLALVLKRRTGEATRNAAGGNLEAQPQAATTVKPF
jgi:Flp pilus assembly protein TadD